MPVILIPWWLNHQPALNLTWIPKTATLLIKGSNKEDVGQVAANIRKIRPPEPYKGKGIQYLGEKIRRKAGKTAKAQRIKEGN